MLHTTDMASGSAPLATGAELRRKLLVAEHGAAWQSLAEAWRQHGSQVSVLIQRSSEPEPAFARRLSAAIASAQLEAQPFACTALVVVEDASPHVEPARARLLQLLAQSLLRAARPIALQVHAPAGASAALCRSLERIQRSVAHEFRGSVQFILCPGEPLQRVSVTRRAV